MPIINDKFKLCITSHLLAKKQKLIELGYEIYKENNEQYVDISCKDYIDIYPYSRKYKINCICDGCNKHYSSTSDGINKGTNTKKINNNYIVYCAQCNYNITNLQRYGYKNPRQSPIIQEKIHKTNRLKYGCDNPLQNKDIQRKIKKTNLQRYGYENPVKSECVKEKIKETNLQRYGCVSTAQVPEGMPVDLTPTATPETGWTFVGWNTSSTATSGLQNLAMGTSNRTLYAIYSKEVTVTFNKNGGAANKTATGTIYNGAESITVTTPAATTYAGWEFNGYAATNNATTVGIAAEAPMTITVARASNTATVYHTWKKEVTITAKFDKNGGVADTQATGTTTIYNGTTNFRYIDRIIYEWKH